MKFLNAPRQPFVGLSLMAAIGIIIADVCPLSGAALIVVTIILAIFIVGVAWRPRLLATYVIVGFDFFLLHNLETSNTEGQQLAGELGSRPRVVTAIGCVITEPKIAPSGFATFLLKLKSIEFEGQPQSTHAVWQVRWKGAPEFGDELKLFGIAEVIAPPRNPGEFNMRAHLARHDVRRMLFVRYPEDGVLIRHSGGNPILRLAQRSRAWMQNALCRGLENAPEVQNFLSGIVLGLRHQTAEDIEEPFQQTGTLHLFAVAGLHVGIVAALLWMLAMVAQLSRKWAAAFIIPLLLFYAAVTGLHVSSIRAAVMSSILLGGLFFERKVFVLNSLAAARHSFFSAGTRTNFFRQVFNSPSRSLAPSYCLQILFLDSCSAGPLPILFCHKACCVARGVGCTPASNGSVTELACLSRLGSVRCRWCFGIFTSSHQFLYWRI
jgi:competence protein ComEC